MILVTPHKRVYNRINHLAMGVAMGGGNGDGGGTGYSGASSRGAALAGLAIGQNDRLICTLCILQ